MITTINEYKKYITENSDNNIIKALADINERRPNRMKKPPTTDGNWFELCRAGQPMGRHCVYIQDEAERICQDKYGKVRGTKMWNDSIYNAPRGAMFKMSDDIMKEKSYLCGQLNLRPSTYWDFSYFALWKMWMDKIGTPYNIDSDEVVATRAAEKQAIIDADAATAKQVAIDKRVNDLNRSIEQLKTKYNTLNFNLVPDTKDNERINKIFTNSGNSFIDTQIQKMANSITNKDKATKRGIAVLNYLIANPNKSSYLSAAENFFRKASQL